MLWDLVVFDVHEPDRLVSSTVPSGGKENSHCGFNLFYDFGFGEREVDDRNGGTDESHDEVSRCVGGENLVSCGRGSYRVCGAREIRFT
jgi:hypothetical protein